MRATLVGGIAVVCFLALTASIGAQQRPNPYQAREIQLPMASPSLRVLPVRDGVFMLEGGGVNMAIQVGEKGMLVVDTLPAAFTAEVFSVVRQLLQPPRNLHFIVNTSAGPDRTGGNETLAKAGRPVDLVPGDGMAAYANSTAAVIAHENVLARLGASAVPVVGWPTVTYVTGQKEHHFNGEGIQLLHQPRAHTDGDSAVYFRRSDVLVTGDVFSFTTLPFFDAERGGTYNGLIDALNRLIDVTITEEKEEGGTIVIPGRGRLADEADLVEYRDMATIVRDRIKDAIDRGLTLEQVKASKPALDYEGRYGMTTGRWTTTMFVEAAYNDLSRR